MNGTRRFITGVLALSFIGCQNNPPVINRARQPILGGTQITVGEFPSVVAIFFGNFSSLCTGELIAPDKVLTAAHCVDVKLAQSEGSTVQSLSDVAAGAVVAFDLTTSNFG